MVWVVWASDEEAGGDNGCSEEHEAFPSPARRLLSFTCRLRGVKICRLPEVVQAFLWTLRYPHRRISTTLDHRCHADHQMAIAQSDNLPMIFSLLSRNCRAQEGPHLLACVTKYARAIPSTPSSSPSSNPTAYFPSLDFATRWAQNWVTLQNGFLAYRFSISPYFLGMFGQHLIGIASSASTPFFHNQT